MHTVYKRGGSYDIAAALNYGHAAGSPKLLKFITDHVRQIHNPQYEGWGSSLTCGSTSGIEIALRIFCNRGDTILMERYTYSGAIEAVALVGAEIQSVDMDAGGLLPESLDAILRSWDYARGPRPKLLYVIPSGQNPTGVTLSLERRQMIYEIAEENDLVILEDDPYYYLQLGVARQNDDGHKHGIFGAEQEARYISNLLPSFLSLDGAGRVVRLDSTSKILAPGLRTGWVTASCHVIQKYVSYQELGVVAVSGASQMMMTSLLCDTWGHRGFSAWLSYLSSEYQFRRDIVLEACDRFLPKHVCDWTPPENGMFLWVRMDWRRHQFFAASAKLFESEASECASLLATLEANIFNKTLARGVQVTKGSMFAADKRPTCSLNFRLTFVAASKCDLYEGVRVFGEVIRDEFDHDTNV